MGQKEDAAVLKDIFGIDEGYREPPFIIPFGCHHVYSNEENEKLLKIGFSTSWGVINEYVSEDGKSFNINRIVFPDGYAIDVNELLEEK
jgi:hypothetical protein